MGGRWEVWERCVWGKQWGARTEAGGVECSSWSPPSRGALRRKSWGWVVGEAWGGGIVWGGREMGGLGVRRTFWRLSIRGKGSCGRKRWEQASEEGVRARPGAPQSGGK